MYIILKILTSVFDKRNDLYPIVNFACLMASLNMTAICSLYLSNGSCPHDFKKVVGCTLF